MSTQPTAISTPAATSPSSADPGASASGSWRVLSLPGYWLKLLASTATVLAAAYVSFSIATSILAHVPRLIDAKAPWWTVLGAFAAAAVAMAPASAWPAIGGAMGQVGSSLISKIGGPK